MSALVEAPSASAAAAVSWTARLSQLNRAQVLRLGLGVVAFLAIVAVGLMMGKQAEWRVLYANLADKDGGAIVAQLSQMNVPYQSSAGGTIMVPADKVYDVRLRLASAGLPKGSVTGYELMDSSRFGMTQFQERLTFQRGLEGELTRSIQSLASVQSARVHLALPNQNGFFREQQKPSASVLLGLHPGRSLERNQVAGIVHLVASSVPELSPSAVSVLDDTGKLLSNTAEGTGAAIDAQQLQYVQQMEQQYSRRILDMLEPLMGRGNVRAQVTADVDFSQTEQTSETHKPNQTAESATVRSQQTSESGAAANAPVAAGVPGATSNQPPGVSAAPINGASAPLSAANGASLGSGAKRESVINYEVDKTTRVVRGATGVVRRLNAAVVVNYQVNPADKGKPVPKALSEQQLEKMTALTRESIGFNKERGDSVNLVNALFAEDKPTVIDVPVWRQPEVQNLAQSFAWPLGSLALAALVLLGFVRPALKTVQQTLASAPRPVSAPGAQLDAMVANDTARPQLGAPARPRELPAPTQQEVHLTEARQLAKDNPIAVANIVKGWVNGEGGA